MAEIPAGEYSHIHRSMSIDQLRLMNERGGLGPLGAALSGSDIRASLAHDYKNFDLRNNDRLDYIPKSNSLDMRHDVGASNNNNNNQADNDLRHPGGDTQQQQQQQQQQDQKPYSSPSTPPTPLSIVDNQMNESKLFNSKSDLQLHSHSQIHMREAKPYKCTQCTKAFANSSYLSQHTRIHLGIKPYRCEVCHRKFTQLSHLQQHIRTHTGDKPYKCRHPGCQKAFSQLSNLQSHSRCHQTDKPYKCNSCYKCFQDENALLEHIPKHKESKHLKTHICQYCGKSYTQETYLSKHMQKHAERSDKRPPIAGLSLAAMNRNLAAMGGNGPLSVATVDHPYWPKVSPDSAANLAEAMQQQQQNQYDFALGQHANNEHLHHRTLLEHHRILNGNADDGGGGNTANGSGGNGTGNTTGEDLVISRQNATNLAQHLVGQNTTVSSAVSASSGNYDSTSITKTSAQSAFTPINSMPHLNSLGHHPMSQRPYFYDIPSKNVNQNPSNSFPNQLISLHQIRNYAHQPGGSGLLPSEHLLGIGVGGSGGGGPGKDKVQ